MSLVEHYSAHHTHQTYSPTVTHTWQTFLVPRDSSVPEFLKKSRSWQMVASKPWPQDFGGKKRLKGCDVRPQRGGEGQRQGDALRQEAHVLWERGLSQNQRGYRGKDLQVNRTQTRKFMNIGTQILPKGDYYSLPERISKAFFK